jgi:hypothetical protein
MSFVTAAVLPTPGKERPFAVMFVQDGIILLQWPVDSVEEGERQIVDAMGGLQEYAKKNGYLK